jgi:hypothetical protein
MIYLLGGAPRAGKTTAGHRFTERTGVSCFSIDYLKMGLVRGMPEFGLDVYDDSGTAEKLWPILRGMIHTYAEEDDSILLEGYYLWPVHVAQLSRELDVHIRSCFIGYCEIPTMQKVHDMREHDPGGWLRGPGGWSDESDEGATEMVEHLKSVSRQIRAECMKYGFRYFDDAGDREGLLAEVTGFLASGHPGRA